MCSIQDIILFFRFIFIIFNKNCWQVKKLEHSTQSESGYYDYLKIIDEHIHYKVSVNIVVISELHIQYHNLNY